MQENTIHMSNSVLWLLLSLRLGGHILPLQSRCILVVVIVVATGVVAVVVVFVVVGLQLVLLVAFGCRCL